VEKKKKWTETFNKAMDKYTWKDKKTRDKAIEDKVIDKEGKFILLQDPSRPIFDVQINNVVRKLKDKEMGTKENRLIQLFIKFRLPNGNLSTNKYGLKDKKEESKPMAMTDKKIITLMKNIDKGRMTRDRVISYEENKNDIREVLENGVEGLEGNVDYYDREVAKYMLKQLKKPSGDKAIEEASDENDGTIFLDFYNKLFNEWKKKIKK